jgi:hypothetical protein
MISRADGGCNPAVAEIMQRLVAETEALCRRRWIFAEPAAPARIVPGRRLAHLSSSRSGPTTRLSQSNNTGCPRPEGCGGVSGKKREAPGKPAGRRLATAGMGY